MSHSCKNLNSCTRYAQKSQNRWKVCARFSQTIFPPAELR